MDSLEEMIELPYLFIRNRAILYVDFIGLMPIQQSGSNATHPSVQNFKSPVIMEPNIKKCRIKATLYLSITVNRNWNQGDITKFKQKAEKVTKNYFNSLDWKCVPSDSCCPCPQGFKVDFNVRYDGNPFSLKVHLIRDPKNVHRSCTWSTRFGGKEYVDNITVDENDVKTKTTIDEASGQSYDQIPFVHEIGHVLGLTHPGGKSNTKDAYLTDPGSLMGIGMEMRAEDFESAFCRSEDFVKKVGQNGKCDYKAE